MRMFITSKNKYLSNDMRIFGTCSIPLRKDDTCGIKLAGKRRFSVFCQFLKHLSRSNRELTSYSLLTPNGLHDSRSI